MPLPTPEDDLASATTPTRVRRWFADWQAKKHLAKDFAEKEKAANKSLQTVVEQLGFTDDKGHQWLDLGESLSGWDAKGNPTTYNALQRQRRVSLFLDEEAAVEILQAKGLLAEAVNTTIEITDPAVAIAALTAAGLLDGDHGVELVSSIAEDKVVDLYFSNKITEDDYHSIVTERISWALLPGNLAQ